MDLAERIALREEKYKRLKERIDEAVKLVDLNWFFENAMQLHPQRHAGSIRYGECPECGPGRKGSVRISVRNGLWKCFACEQAGDVVKAAQKYWGLSASDAVDRLLGADPELLKQYVAPKALPQVDRDLSVVVEAVTRLTQLCELGPTPEALKYFELRGISAPIVHDACRRKLMVTLPSDPARAKDVLIEVIGKDLLYASGMWGLEAKAPAAIFRPLGLIGSLKTGVEWRYLRKAAKNESKVVRNGEAGYWGWRGVDTDRILITEGFIDLLSAIEMGSQRSVLALPGCQNWDPCWFSGLEGLDVCSALDNDAAGNKATSRLITEIEKIIGRPVTQYPPCEGAKDLNDELLLRRGLPLF